MRNYRSLAAVCAAALSLLSVPARADSDGAVAPGTPATRSALQGCIYRSTPVTAVDGQQLAANCDPAGNLIVSGGASTSTAPAAPATATATTSMLTGCVQGTPTFTAAQQGAVSCGLKGSLSVQIMAVDGTQGAAVGGTPADGTLNNAGVSTGLVVQTRPYTYNGSTWDLGRSILNGTNSTGTGIQAVGPVAQFDDITPTPITENSYGALRLGQNRTLLVAPYESRANNWRYNAASGGISNTTTAVTIQAADATRRVCITSLQIANSTLGAATEVALRDGAAGTVIWRGYVGTVASNGGGGFEALNSPICGTPATLMEFVTLTASVSGAVYINAQGFLAL